jgi:CheY-like chemotaxis protein
MIPSFYLAMQLTVPLHSLLDVLSALADAKSLLIFRSIVSEDVDSNVLLKRTNLTLKQESKKQGEIRDSTNILLVENAPDVFLSFKTVLVSYGYNVDVFTDSFEAFKHFTMLNRPFYNLALLDIRMKGMNGIQLYQKLKTIDDRLRIRFITALDAASELVSLVPNLDALQIIKKPISNEDLLNTVKTAVSSPPSHQVLGIR